jgi:hypothetical protein
MRRECGLVSCTTMEVGRGTVQGRRTRGCTGGDGGASSEQSGGGCGAAQAAAEGPEVSNPAKGCGVAQAVAEGCGAVGENIFNQSFSTN